MSPVSKDIELLAQSVLNELSLTNQIDRLIDMTQRPMSPEARIRIVDFLKNVAAQGAIAARTPRAEDHTPPFLEKTNTECRAWMETFYNADAIEDAFLYSLWAWQAQEKRYAQRPFDIANGVLPSVMEPQVQAMIETIMRERGWPCNPMAAARVGYEAARRLFFRQSKPAASALDSFFSAQSKGDANG